MRSSPSSSVHSRPGEPVTVRLVKRVIDEAAATVSAQSVYRTAVAWEHAVGATQRRARA